MEEQLLLILSSADNTGAPRAKQTLKCHPKVWTEYGIYYWVENAIEITKPCDKMNGLYRYITVLPTKWDKYSEYKKW